jgi:hypothetical protein
MARKPSSRDDEAYIIDTRCIGFYVFNSDKLLTRVTSTNSSAIKDFSGITHSSNVKGSLLSTQQKVLVMPTAKVNLNSTEQLFYAHDATFAVLTEDNCVFFDKNSKQISQLTIQANWKVLT